MNQCTNYLELIVIFETNDTFMEQPHTVTVVNLLHGLCPSVILAEIFPWINTMFSDTYYPISKGISIPERSGLYQPLLNPAHSV